MSLRKLLYILVKAPSRLVGSMYLVLLKKDFAYFGNRVVFRDLSDKTLEGRRHISIGDRCIFGKGIVLTAWDRHKEQRFSPVIRIGKNCNFGAYNHISSINEITIGNDVLTGRWVTIADNSHGATDASELSIAPMERPLYSKGPIKIDDNVWIGDKATILPGVHIGRGAVIGANCVVSKNVPPYSVVVGNPGRVIKRLALNEV